MRASRVAFFYLKSQMEVENLLNENQIEDAIQDALDTLYGPIINNWLRNQSIEFIFSKIYDLVKNFHSDEDPPKELLDSELKSYKNDLIRILESVAKSEKDSIKEQATFHFRSNPTANQNDITDYIRKTLNNVKRI